MTTWDREIAVKKDFFNTLQKSGKNLLPDARQ